jgi:hypothetical protein
MPPKPKTSYSAVASPSKTVPAKPSVGSRRSSRSTSPSPESLHAAVSEADFVKHIEGKESFSSSSYSSSTHPSTNAPSSSSSSSMSSLSSHYPTMDQEQIKLFMSFVNQFMSGVPGGPSTPSASPPSVTHTVLQPPINVIDGKDAAQANQATSSALPSTRPIAPRDPSSPSTDTDTDEEVDLGDAPPLSRVPLPIRSRGLSRRSNKFPMAAQYSISDGDLVMGQLLVNEEDRHAPGAIQEVLSVFGSFSGRQATLEFTQRRNDIESGLLCAIIDCILAGRCDVALEHLVRRLEGIEAAEEEGNWDLDDVLKLHRRAALANDEQLKRARKLVKVMQSKEAASTKTKKAGTGAGNKGSAPAKK